MQHNWVMATGNPGKVRELNRLLSPLNVNLRVQSEFDVPEAAETGTTFVENAIIKARNACEATGLPAVADDSGLVVPNLGGAPGVISSRYAGEKAGDDENVRKLLRELVKTDDKERQAKFVCVMVMMRHANDPTPIITQGEWFGSIAHERQGNGGFGYDPVFWVSEYNCTAAELSAEVKNRISHRGKATQKLIGKLEPEFG
ncbi:XTP/dITP diphosphatase [Saliniradius amylolyticus]|uniref:dITP/XTP pyrophosphatase n=1 Tax=Saliniradius amylolyticus TaxID=2183582 RepID=A0A2S2E517_9ALTE|nr:RdgB/HAM1 family non-canonical purine NTP pyrophosphatase [Saliniradius amylolyticus]AWL12748.1 XTP/dITP diphosphatase [Saliniradius amylolyticus]